MNVIQSLPNNPAAGTEVKLLLKDEYDSIILNFNNLPYMGNDVSNVQISITTPLQEVSLIYIDEQIGWIPNHGSIVSTQSQNNNQT